MNWKAIFKWGLPVILGIGLYCLWSNQSTYQKIVVNNQFVLHDLQTRTKQETKVVPSVKVVQNDYSKGLAMAKTFLQYQNRLHANGNDTFKSYRQDLQSLNRLMENPEGLTTPLVHHDIGGWMGKIYYGGENSNRQVAMAYRFYSGKQLMYITTFYYDAMKNKLTSFISYPTYAGQKTLQQTFTDKN